MLTDNGIQFTNRAFEWNGIKHRVTKVKHPWTNGQVKRMSKADIAMAALTLDRDETAFREAGQVAARGLCGDAGLGGELTGRQRFAQH